jgi:hypothetical protein
MIGNGTCWAAIAATVALVNAAFWLDNDRLLSAAFGIDIMGAEAYTFSAFSTILRVDLWIPVLRHLSSFLISCIDVYLYVGEQTSPASP